MSMMEETINEFFEDPVPKLIKWGLTIIVAVIAIQLCLHALNHKNGTEVIECLGNTPQQQWEKIVQNPFTGKTDKHVYCIYLTNSGKYGIFEYVQNDFLSKLCGESAICRQVTAMVKEKMKNINQVENYLRNGGAFRVK